MQTGHVADLLAACGADLPGFVTLPPFLRTLLVTDGTVTTTLEAWCAEPILVQQVIQEARGLVLDNAALGLAAGTPVVHRRVTLVGAETGRRYVDAESLICVDAMPEALRQGLARGQFGIGELLRLKAVETRREIIHLFRTGEHISRTYLIWLAQRPVIQVTEHFPLALYCSLTAQSGEPSSH